MLSRDFFLWLGGISTLAVGFSVLTMLAVIIIENLAFHIIRSLELHAICGKAIFDHYRKKGKL